MVLVGGSEEGLTRSAERCSLCKRRSIGSGCSAARGTRTEGVERSCFRHRCHCRPEADLAEAGGGELKWGERVGAVGVSDAEVGGGGGPRVSGRGGGEGVVWWTCGWGE